MARISIAVAAITLGVICVVGYLWAERTVLVPGRQIGNLADLQAIAGCITEVHDVTLAWPGDLEDAFRRCESVRQVQLADRLKKRTDRWGHPIVYETRPDGFILASLGRDGVRDRDNLWGYRQSPVGCADDSPCRDASADTVISDLGYHRCCGK